jgi:hypothetical protein
MAAGPQRRAQRVTHLNAQVRPVELALEARAKMIEAEAVTFISGDDAARAEIHLHEFVAGEFRALAEELHWWG